MLIKTLFTLSIFGISACSSLNDQERSPEDQKKASNFDSKSSEVSDIFSEMDNMKNEFVSNRTGLYLLYNLSPGNYENCEQVETYTNEEGNSVLVEDCDSPSGLPVRCKTETLTNGKSVSCSSIQTSTDGTNNQGTGNSGDAVQIDTPTNTDMMPQSGTPSSCDDAINQFASMYEGAKKQFESMREQLKNPNSQFKEDDNIKMIKNNISGSSVKYSYIPKKPQAGFEVSGSISGGAEGDIVTISQIMSMQMDPNSMQMPGSQLPTGSNIPDGFDDADGSNRSNLSDTVEMNVSAKTKANLNSKTIVLDLKMESKKGEMDSDLRTRVEISAGEEKYVKQQISSKDKGIENTNMNMEARLIDSNTISIKGQGAIAGESMTLDYLVIRDNDGTCKIEMKN
jgi:hypothetical protein